MDTTKMLIKQIIESLNLDYSDSEKYAYYLKNETMKEYIKAYGVIENENN